MFYLRFLLLPFTGFLFYAISTGVPNLMMVVFHYSFGSSWLLVFFVGLFLFGFSVGLVNLALFTLSEITLFAYKSSIVAVSVHALCGIVGVCAFLTSSDLNGSIKLLNAAWIVSPLKFISIFLPLAALTLYIYISLIISPFFTSNLTPHKQGCR